MATDRDQWAENLSGDSGGWLTGFLAEEDEFDRRSLWRLGSWGVGSVAAVIVALLANHSSVGWRREQTASADLVRQSQQIQWVAKESQNETRRLASAIDTLNSDRDRLYARVTVLEQGLDSVTGAIARKNPAPASAKAASTSSATVESQSASQSPAPTPPASPVATTVATPAEKPRSDAAVPQQAPATVSSPGHGTLNAPEAPPVTPLMASKSMMAPPDSGAVKLIEPEPVATPPKPEVVASAPTGDNAEADASQAAPKPAAQRTEFGAEGGGA